MLNQLIASRPHLPTAAVFASGGVGTYLWMERATSILGFMTAVGAFLTMLVGLIFWCVKTWRFINSKAVE